MLSDDTCGALRCALDLHSYTVDSVVAAIGEAAHRALGRNSTVAAVRALEGRTDALATLTLLWPLQQRVAVTDLERALPNLVQPLVDAKILTRTPDTANHDTVTAAVDIRPYASDDGAAGWIVSDLSPGLDTTTVPIRPDFVLGVSSASTTLAQLIVRTPVGRALDLGAGCGVQSLHLARHADHVVATDLNPRAVALADLTFRINGVGNKIDLRTGNLYEPVADEQFDLIVTNPPYVMSPPNTDVDRLTYREGTYEADGLVQHVVEQGARRLADGGTLEVLANWAHRSGEDWTDRIRGWVEPTGCDALVIQRETLDPYEYVELWLADAGLAGAPDYTQRYAAWLDYFAGLGIEAVGMGWIVLHKTGHATPDLRIEDWPYPVEQPIGPAIEAQRHDLAFERSLSDEALLARHWILNDDIVQESTATPGAEDPHHVVLRQQRGFRRAVEVDTAQAGILGACDGELALGAIVDVVAGIVDVDVAALREATIRQVRTLARDGFLTA